MAKSKRVRAYKRMSLDRSQFRFVEFWGEKKTVDIGDRKLTIVLDHQADGWHGTDTESGLMAFARPLRTRKDVDAMLADAEWRSAIERITKKEWYKKRCDELKEFTAQFDE